MFSNNLLAGVSGQGGGYNIENSLRFNDDDSAYLSRTPASAGNRKTWTWSGWVKRGNVGINGYLFGADTAVGSGDGFGFISSDQLKVYVNGAVTGDLVTNALFRDVGGWYHLIVSADSTQATASNRIKVYVNGEQVTSFATETYPPQNFDFDINGVFAHWLGRVYVYYSDGYMAEINFIDGQALTADDFGEIDSDTGEWSPKKYSGTYGTNGFYLAFEDGSALGDDTSGNANDWTPTNLASTDQMLDTPTNNFAVLNAIGGGISETLSEGNLSVTTPNAGNTTATIGVTSGKWYWEGRLKNDNYYSVGLTNEAGAASTVSMSASGSNSVGYWSGGGIYDESGLVATVASYGTADVVASALDMDSGNIKFYKNNSLIYTYTFGSSGAGTTFPVAFPAVNSGGFIGRATDTNFGADSSFAGNKTRQGNTDANGKGDFYYTPPTGYLALCTDNLAEPAIVDSETQFNVVTYTGTGTTNAVSGVGFQPDFVWLKERNNTAAHFVYDSVRGATLGIHTNLTDAEATYTDGLTSFDTDGFTVGSRSNNNGLGDTYVAWCWKAGGTAVTNTDGTITSQVSANVDAGFSIVSYTGNSTSGATIGHGLNSAPEVVIAKGRAIANSWHVYTKSTGAANVLLLDSTAALYTSNSVWWNNTDPNSTVVTLGSGSGTNSSSAMIAYCFHSVEGFSKFGSYTGNGSADGPFIYTGFRPAFVMIKRTDSTSDWTLLDTSRSTYNVVSNRLWANLSTAESTAGLPLDIVSNGFKLRTSDAYANASGGTYIYMAFAESPTKFSLGR